MAILLNTNVTSILNVTGNIANTGNLLVTQNTFTGNLSVTQNVSAGNISAANVVVTNPLAQFANSGVYVAGTLVANNPNINFVAANTSNLSITGTSNTSPGNVTITFDTRVPPGGGGISTGSAANLASLNVAGNIANAGNILISQNLFTGNLAVIQNATFGNINAASMNVTSNFILNSDVGGSSGNSILTLSGNNAYMQFYNTGGHIYGFLGTVYQSLGSGSNSDFAISAYAATGNLVFYSGGGNFKGLIIDRLQGNVQACANVQVLNGVILCANIFANNIVVINGTPLISTITRAMTGLSANLTANAQTNNNTAQTNVLSCTFNEAGMYQIEAMIFYGTTSGAQASNVGNVGMNIAFGNSGTATIATIKYAVTGKSNGNTIISNLITTKSQTQIVLAGSTLTGSIANSTNNTDYITLTGYLNVSAIGTINIQIASANSLNANLNVSTNSFVVYTKIG